MSVIEFNQQQAHSSYGNLIIHDDADLAVNIVGITTKYDSMSSQEQEVSREGICFHLKREKLSALPPARQTQLTAIQVMLSSTWRESLETHINFEVSMEELRGTELMLCIFADVEIPSRLLQAPPEYLWHLANALDYWNISEADASVRRFFDLWFQEASKSTEQRRPDELIDYLRTLLWPAWYYDNPHAFWLVTRYLIYHGTGHIEPKNPTRFHEIFLPRNIVGKYTFMLQRQSGANTAL
jgi:hypothetical protein